MRHTDWLSKSLAVVGTVLVAIPLVLTVLTGIASPLLTDGRFLVDWLMPAELFPLIGVGSVMLLIVALRSRVRRIWVLGGLAVMAVSLLGGALIAQVTGLANGDIEPAGWPWALVIGAMTLYIAAVFEMVVAGSLIARDLFTHRSDEHAVPPAVPVG